MTSKLTHHLPLVDRSKPKVRSDLVGNEATINGVYLYLKNWKYGKSQPAALLIGPSGCGKTSAIYAIAEELDYSVTEFNASDTRSKKKINENLRIAVEFHNLMEGEEKKLILMDEIDGISGQYDRGGLNEFLKLLKISKYPILCTANDPESDKIATLLKKGNFRVYEFTRLEEYEIYDLLVKTVSKTNMNVDGDILELIAESSSGDIRAALNELDSFGFGQTSALVKRDKSQVLTDLFNQLFNAKNYSEARAVWSNAPSDYYSILLHLFDQTAYQCRSPQETLDCYNQLAKADLILSRIQTTQNWSLLKYFFNIIGPGIVLSRKKSKPSRVKKLGKYPTSFRMRGISKNKNSKAIKIAPKVAPRLHISKNKFIHEEFNLFTKIILGRNGAEVAAWLDLDDDDIETIFKIDISSSLIDEIEKARQKIGRFRLDITKQIGVDVSFKVDNYLLSEFEEEENDGGKSEPKDTKEKSSENIQQSLDDFF